MTLHVNVRASSIYFNVEYANFNKLEKVRLPLTSASKTIKNANSEKSILACKNFNEPDHNFHHHAEFTLIEQIRKETEETIKPLKKEKILWILNYKLFTQIG